MNITTIITIIGLIVVGTLFTINTGKDKDEFIKNTSKGVQFQSGINNMGKKKIEYDIFTHDYGVHWWAIRKSGDRWHVIGSADEVYPGLIKMLNDPIHAELELQSHQDKQKKKEKKKEE